MHHTYTHNMDNMQKTGRDATHGYVDGQRQYDAIYEEAAHEAAAADAEP